MFRNRYLEIIVTATILYSKLFGFWPYTYHRDNKKFEKNFYEIIYTFCIAITITFIFKLCAETVFENMNNAFHNRTADLFVYGIGFYHSVIFALMYILQFKSQGRIIEIINEFVVMQPLINKCLGMWNQRFTNSMVLFTIKVIVITGLLIYGYFVNIKVMTNDKLKLWFMLLGTIPVFVTSGK